MVDIDMAARPSSMRDIKWPVWVLLVLAALVLAFSATQSGVHLSTFSFVSPLVFAAAVVHVAPRDRRFVWAAVLIALMPAVAGITAWLPDFWFDTVPGDWKNATPLLMELGQGAREIVQVLGYVGLALLGVALGGVRTRVSVAILGVGVLLALASVIRLFGLTIELPPIDLARSIAGSFLYAVGWAFVFAAAVESRRTLMAIGAGVTFALIAFDRLQDWWLALPSGPLDTLLLVAGALALLGWVLMIASPLRGELNGAPSRTTGDL